MGKTNKTGKAILTFQHANHRPGAELYHVWQQDLERMGYLAGIIPGDLLYWHPFLVFTGGLRACRRKKISGTEPECKKDPQKSPGSDLPDVAQCSFCIF